ncbi:MAG: ATPase AAA-2 protein [uncultured bacterium]|nr:MAG: ATPase AAA-2 protein [uncultured bacterium]
MHKETPASSGRPNFFLWYYNEGILGILEIWKNFLFFAFQHFSIAEMFATLFSPWRRDVSAPNWRGFHPIRMLELVFVNTLSRLIGACIRLFVIALGLIVAVFVFIFGVEITILWVSMPMVLLILALYVANGSIDAAVGSGLALICVILAISGYLHDSKAPTLGMDKKQFLKNRVLERIAARLGFARKRFPDEILFDEEKLDEFLKIQGLTIGEYRSIMRHELLREQEKIDARKFWSAQNLKKIASIGVQWRYGYTVHLDRYCSDLSFDCSEYRDSVLVGRQEEYEVLKMILARPDQNCAILVGPTGVGKKVMLHTLGRNIKNRQESQFENCRLLTLDLGRVISDSINKGADIENVLRMLFYEASYAGNVILLIEHMEYFLANDGNSMHPDISHVLNEFLNIPTFQIIALSTPKEYHRLIENHDHIAKYFEVVEVREPTEDESIEIMLAQMGKYEKQRILFTYKALKRIVHESGKLNWKFPLPERAVDLAMDTLMFWEKKSDEQFITEKTVADYLSFKTGIKHGEIESEERNKLLNLEKKLHMLVIGQDEAVRQVSEAFRRARSGIGNSHKPVGSFLFFGPTGVGKTETAKALAKTYFGDSRHLVRLDMSEFKSPGSIDRLLGSNQTGEPGRLVTLIKDNPYCLLLLDEIEKAYPEILDIFLQILDEGYVTDSFGEKINFRNTLIIATSNAGAPLIKRMVEEKHQSEEIKSAVLDWTIENNVFRTEFLNRFDGVVFFRPLKDEELVSVVRLQLQKFVRRLSKEKNIEIEFGESVIGQIIKKGYNPIFGARSLNRYIEDEIEGLVARKIISGEVLNGQKIRM